MKLLLILTFLFSVETYAVGGGSEIGNGGDGVVMEVSIIATRISTYALSSPNQDVNLQTLGAAISSTKIESTSDELFLAGEVKDAINYPKEKRIVFNRHRWSQLAPQAKASLVLHEYLGVMGIKDDKYQISKEIVSNLRYCRNRKNQEQFENRAKEQAIYHCGSFGYNSLTISMISLGIPTWDGETALMSYKCGAVQYLGMLQTSPADDCQAISHQVVRSEPVN